MIKFTISACLGYVLTYCVALVTNQNFTLIKMFLFFFFSPCIGLNGAMANVGVSQSPPHSRRRHSSSLQDLEDVLSNSQDARKRNTIETLPDSPSPKRSRYLWCLPRKKKRKKKLLVQQRKKKKNFGFRSRVPLLFLMSSDPLKMFVG